MTMLILFYSRGGESKEGNIWTEEREYETSEERTVSGYKASRNSGMYEPCQEITAKFLNFSTPENSAEIYLKFKQRDETT